jgi:SlyX protein
MSEQQIAELQEKLAFLELANNDLSDEIYRQQRDLTTLQLAHRKLVERFEQFEFDSATAANGSDNAPPPHY